MQKRGNNHNDYQKRSAAALYAQLSPSTLSTTMYQVRFQTITQPTFVQCIICSHKMSVLIDASSDVDVQHQSSRVTNKRGKKLADELTIYIGCPANEQYPQGEHTGSKAHINFYSSDLWHLIALYIQPEDVRRYALLCRTTYEATRTGRFWRALYSRCKIKSDAFLLSFLRFCLTNAHLLPAKMQAPLMPCSVGIRPFVVRALKAAYNPMRTSTKTGM